MDGFVFLIRIDTDELLYCRVFQTKSISGKSSVTSARLANSYDTLFHDFVGHVSYAAPLYSETRL